jgi:hypothetical protein
MASARHPGVTIIVAAISSAYNLEQRHSDPALVMAFTQRKAYAHVIDGEYRANSPTPLTAANMYQRAHSVKIAVM